MNQSRFGPWLAIAIGTLYFVLPLIATFEFSLRLRRGANTADSSDCSMNCALSGRGDTEGKTVSVSRRGTESRWAVNPRRSRISKSASALA